MALTARIAVFLAATPQRSAKQLESLFEADAR
jgi:hypothetical protein